MSKDSVTWDRRAAGTSDGYGDPVPASADGFPRTVRGNWQPRKRARRASEHGDGVQIDAVFYSELFTAGRIDDRVTVGGVAYKVVEATPITALRGSGVAHTEYRLQRLLGGDQQ